MQVYYITYSEPPPIFFPFYLLLPKLHTSYEIQKTTTTQEKKNMSEEICVSWFASNVISKKESLKF